MARTARPDAFAPLPMASLPPVSRLLVGLGYALAHWDMRRRSRLALTRLDRQMLRDIGLSPDEAQTECAKRFWQD